jgi:tetratricopeptide (TPR) repeat protein
MSLYISFLLILAAPSHFQINGRVVSAGLERIVMVQIESIDHRFVAYADVDLDFTFRFKKIPEGLYKLNVVTQTGRAIQRTLEVRSEFADPKGNIATTIDLRDARIPADQFRIGAAAMSVSDKARDELRRARDAKGNTEKAKEHLEKAIVISPNFDEALNDLGTIYYRDAQYDKARELFERALTANPNSYPARVNLGGALISLGDYSRALDENLKALEMRPDDSLAQSQTGQTLFRLGRFDEAMTHLQTAKRVDPMSFTFPGLFIAQIYEVRGDKANAIAEYSEFLKVHPATSFRKFVESRLTRLRSQTRPE